VSRQDEIALIHQADRQLISHQMTPIDQETEDFMG